MAKGLIFSHGDIVIGNYPIFCQQVNCKGVMGAGLAKQIREWYPEVYELYHNWCEQEPTELLGSIQPIMTHDKRICINLFAQDWYGNDGKCYTDYDAFQSCLSDLKQFLSNMPEDETVAFPYGIGCGLGGGDWPTIRGMICELAVSVPQRIVIVKR